MTERGLPIVDGAPACPFVAFDDDRDERASSPDQRHRCYAEAKPAPRAFAHQEAYCLSSSFPVCPTFQDWARREAARARTGAGGAAASGAPSSSAASSGAGAAARSAGAAGVAGGFAAGASGLAGFDDQDVDAPDFLARRTPPERGLAGSAADRMAGVAGEPAAASLRSEGDAPDREAAAMGAGAMAAGAGDAPEFVRGRPAQPSGLDDDFDDGAWDEPAAPAAGSAGRGRAGGIGFGDRRPKVGDTRPKRREPEPEPARRYEAYPTLRTRLGLQSGGSMPRVAVLALALVIAAIALFFLPTLLGVGRPPDRGVGGGGGASSAPSAAPSIAASPTETPAPTAQVYVVQSGDTLSKIASQFGVSLAQLIEANRTTLPDPDKLQIGDQLIIPVPGASGSPSASTAPVSPSP
jgi:LysM repeat protein